MIEEFKRSQDYIDICYMIDHVSDISVRLNVLEELGYKLGVDITKKDLGEKHVIIGKHNEIRMQVTPKFNNINISRCVVIQKNKIFYQDE